MDRCSWAREEDILLMEYHDTEYGQIKAGDTALFEKLCLECFQAGLSWRTVLYKREAFREVFYGFDPLKVAAMTERDVERLMQDSRIIRNRRKIEASIHNAGKILDLLTETGSLKTYFYSFKSGGALSADLKKRGFLFAGETICEALLMSIGAIEGHEAICFLYGQNKHSVK
jgi:DNA-3-methyladenine glycosylase I